MFSPYFHPVCTNCLHYLLCGLTNIGYVLFWFFGFIVVLACAISCLCVTRMANIINVPILKCIAGCYLFFPPLPQWWWLQTPWFILFVLTALFRWCQKGEDRHDHDYFDLTWLELTLYNLVSTLAWLVLALAYLCLLCQYGHLVCHHQKGGICWAHTMRGFDDNKPNDHIDIKAINKLVPKQVKPK